MEIVLQILTVIACVLLILVVLIQDSKGGGLSSTFGASNQILGVRRTTDFLEKTTWVLAIGLIVLSLASSYFGGQTTTNGTGSVTQNVGANLPSPQQNNPPAGNNQGGNAPQPAPSQSTPTK